MTGLALAGLGLWVLIALLPWRPWSTRETLNALPRTDDLSDVTALVPARDEVEHIERTLRSLAAQDARMRIILVDDESTDGTGARARELQLPQLTVLEGRPHAPGWSGKLWALEQGRAQVRTPLTLLVDADITLDPGLVAALRDKLRLEGLASASLMVQLRMRGFWERLLVPAFVYFFKLLYPFRLANSSVPWVAAAAGGCILVRTEVLDSIGGFGALRGALIDDCTLARLIKSRGYRSFIGLTRSAHSRRRYDDLRALWDMVARTAYTQLRYSPALLALCTLLMLLAFVVPVAAVAAGGAPARLGAAAWVIMAATFYPTIAYYRLPPAWALALPAAGALYLGMTWSSALRFWRGERSRWKGRSYRGPA
ncbi:MAG: glycosyltransferase [Gammaproteobacteria bacterium]